MEWYACHAPLHEVAAAPPPTRTISGRALDFIPPPATMIHWIPLQRPEQLETIVTASNSRPQVIFKHSTRCSVSSMVLNRLEREEQPAAMDFYFLDLISYRPISNDIAERFHVHHESPQIIIIKNGEAIFDESHLAIQMDEITSFT